ESALTISPSSARASLSARADLPLAVGPAISQMRGVMELVLTVVTPPAAGAFKLNLADAFASIGATGKTSRVLSGEADDMAMDVFFDAPDLEAARDAVAAAIEEQRLDWCVQPVAGRRKRLLVADMDSTIINVECLDELADFAGVKAQVSEITE